MTFPELGGSVEKTPTFIEPMVEDGVSSLKLPRNYFLIFDVRKISETMNLYLSKNLVSDAMPIYGNGAYQYWEIAGSICMRVYSTEVQLSKFIVKAKESMRIWGIRDPNVTVYPADQPRRA